MGILSQRWVKLFLVYLSLLGSASSFAENKENVSSSSFESTPKLPSIVTKNESVSTESLISNRFSLKAEQANWVFSGIVASESGEYYSYFFQMRRQGNQLNTLAALINDQNKEVILFEENQANIENSEENYWRVGNAFLKFNTINNSWIFGVRGKNKTGFNFKVDMLSRAGETVYSKASELRAGVNFLINQTGRLNGHIQLGEGIKAVNKEKGIDHFVTAHTAWFRQIWLTKPQDSLHPFQGILCQFNEGNGFFSLSLAEQDALIGSIAGWRNPEGKPVRMSQFVTANQLKSGEWRIDISSPKLDLFFKNALTSLDKEHLIMGTIENKPGFCVINKDSIG